MMTFHTQLITPVHWGSPSAFCDTLLMILPNRLDLTKDSNGTGVVGNAWIRDRECSVMEAK